MKKHQNNTATKVCVIAIIAFFACFAYGLSPSNFVSRTSGFELDAGPTPVSPTTAPVQKKALKFTDFPHSGKQHSKLACDACHKFPSANWKQVRKESDAFPDVTEYPKHESCLKCHREQFFGSPKPNICSVCHTNPSARDSSRYPFPNPREIFDLSAKGKQAASDFGVNFPHATHIELLSKNKSGPHEFVQVSFTAARRDAGEKSCTICHQTYQPQGTSDDEYVTKPPAKLGDAFWLKKGTFKTAPTGHTQCFTCHSQEAGMLPAPNNCAACHKLAEKLPKIDFDPAVAVSMGELDKITLASWRKRDSSATFRHEFSSHVDLDCASCHNVTAIKTTEFLTKKVPVTSCNVCHITEKSDDGGILNYELDERKKDANFQCVKCHISYGKMPVPESHLKAVADLAGK